MAENEPSRRRNHRTPGHVIGSLIGGAIDHAVGSVGSVGKYVSSAMHLPGLGRKGSRHAQSYKPGSVAGIEHEPDVNTPPPPDTVRIQCINYGQDKVEVADIDDLEALLAKPIEDWTRVRWINIDGLHPWVINKVREAVGMHTLAAEDVLHVPQRPRLEPYENDLFIISRMMRLIDDRLLAEQISMFMSGKLVITFQEMHGDVWDPIRERINRDNSRLRQHGPSFLIYALLDALVDHCFPILERYSDVLEELEAKVLEEPDDRSLAQVHAIKRELSVLRRVIWPMREVVATMRDTEHPAVSKVTRTYLRDVYEHTVQIVEIIETFRENANGLTDLHMSAVSNRMNETMKVLTIMATLFIPITFLAGIYGMNFEFIPELSWKFGYPAFWLVCISVVGGLLWYFRSKGWIGR